MSRPRYKLGSLIEVDASIDDEDKKVILFGDIVGILLTKQGYSYALSLDTKNFFAESKVLNAYRPVHAIQKKKTNGAGKRARRQRAQPMPPMEVPTLAAEEQCQPPF